MHNRNSKERIRRLQQTSQHIIPRNKRSNNAESATSSCQSHVREVIGCVARIEVCRSQANESQPDHEKQRAEGESRFECHQPEQEGEDEPGEDLMERGEVSLGFKVRGLGVVSLT
jgi:hypothetical protein